MLSDDELRQALPYILTKTDFPFLGEKYQGKVRDTYRASGLRYLVTTDRLSCFDVVVTSIPFKGQVLNELALHWFEQTKHIIPNHVIASPDPNVVVVADCEVLPIEVVVRGYLSGSAWRDYSGGKEVSGVRFPAGLRENQRLDCAVLTPSTKAHIGEHDAPISESEIVGRNIVPKALWEQVRKSALELFNFGQEQAAAHGLILADTKYEFGIRDGDLFLVDEVHTLDCSRYWVEESYQDRFERAESPIMLDKQPMRDWLLKQGYSGNGPVPIFTDDHRIEIAKHYLRSFERISGKPFHARTGDVAVRMQENLERYKRNQ